MLKSLVAVFIGSGIGAALRYVITLFCKNILGFSFLGTFIVNMIGCFLIGLIFGLTLLKTELLPEILKLFLIVGLLGGLTTFSTFSLEVTEFLIKGNFLIGISLLLVSCVVAVILVLAGIYLSKFIQV